MRIIACIIEATVLLASASANRPEGCAPAPHCRAIDPGICCTTAWAEDRRRSLAA